MKLRRNRAFCLYSICVVAGLSLFLFNLDFFAHDKLANSNYEAVNEAMTLSETQHVLGDSPCVLDYTIMLGAGEISKYRFEEKGWFGMGPKVVIYVTFMNGLVCSKQRDTESFVALFKRICALRRQY